MDKFEKKYNWNELKAKLSKHEPKDSIWDDISSSLDEPIPIYNFQDIKDQLPEHSPSEKLWDDIRTDLEQPDHFLDIDKAKEQLAEYTPKPELWNNIAKILDSPRPIYNFEDQKDKLPNYTPSSEIWDQIENDLEINQKLEKLPLHEPSKNIWEKIEEDLEEVKSGISFIRIAIMMGLSMLLLISVSLILNQNDQDAESLIDNSMMMFAASENYKIEWSDDEDVRLIQEMCQDYMAVCEQEDFKKLENELLQLNGHKRELLNLVSEFDEESTYGPMLAKIEIQKTALMKEMIAMI